MGFLKDWGGPTGQLKKVLARKASAEVKGVVQLAGTWTWLVSRKVLNPAMLAFFRQKKRSENLRKAIFAPFSKNSVTLR